MRILFDIGATKTRIAAAHSLESFDTPVVYATPANYQDGITSLSEHISSLLNGQKVEAIAGCIAGLWDEEKGCITESGNLLLWHEKPLKNDLLARFNTKVMINNDAACAGLGEAIYGAGRGYDTELYMTVSTGVGGAVIANKQILKNLEPRKQLANENGETLGQLISGNALEKKTGKKPKDIHDPVLWDSVAKTLATGLLPILQEYSPSVVVVGGSMMNEVGISLVAVEKYLREMFGSPSLPPIRKADLADFGGLYGDLAVIRNMQ